MARYEFDCENCGPIVVEHGMTEDHPEVCPNCGGEITRHFFSPSITFRGSGFYTTDKVLSEPTEDEKTEQALKDNAKERLSRA